MFIGAGIDPDPPDPFIDLRGNRVAMDDHQLMARLVFEKRIANPAKIGLCLLGQCDAGPDAGMDEQIVAGAQSVGKAGEKGLMLRRDRRAQRFDRLALHQFA